jgi:phospholipid/cholesterol/gamma-HCH transport system ATP-binding protein
MNSSEERPSHNAEPSAKEVSDNNLRTLFPAKDDPARVVPAVEFRHVSFSYQDHDVLDDISFAVMRGELLIILSSSGGGKSTILKLTLGLFKPDEGQILIDGEDITNYDEGELNRVRQKIGMDFQDGALFDSLSVYDNVAFRCHENGVPEDQVEREVRRLLQFVDLEDAIDRMPAELSGGMRIRVGIARSLVGNPHILLFDEPTAGLDPPTARHISELVIKLRDLEDTSSIFITHQLDRIRDLSSNYAAANAAGETVIAEEGERLCLVNTRIMMLREGSIIFNGRHRELFDSQDPYIRDFVRA